ncbi:hypothetical protein HHI36_017810 [Cryptolaemus montrouzieri]|uniref:Gustatory receptor n=1 Tax=Cryptolaemus montrouzieri TaxID=559131 RepID=A0ABD2NNP5_9CUCU
MDSPPFIIGVEDWMSFNRIKKYKKLTVILPILLKFAFVSISTIITVLIVDLCNDIFDRPVANFFCVGFNFIYTMASLLFIRAKKVVLKSNLKHFCKNDKFNFRLSLLRKSVKILFGIEVILITDVFGPSIPEHSKLYTTSYRIILVRFYRWFTEILVTIFVIQFSTLLITIGLYLDKLEKDMRKAVNQKNLKRFQQNLDYCCEAALKVCSENSVAAICVVNVLTVIFMVFKITQHNSTQVMHSLKSTWFVIITDRTLRIFFSFLYFGHKIIAIIVKFAPSISQYAKFGLNYRMILALVYGLYTEILVMLVVLQFTMLLITIALFLDKFYEDMQLSSHRTDFKILHQYIEYCCEAASKVCGENSIPAILIVYVLAITFMVFQLTQQNSMKGTQSQKLPWIIIVISRTTIIFYSFLYFRYKVIAITDNFAPSILQYAKFGINYRKILALVYRLYTEILLTLFVLQFTMLLITIALFLDKFHGDMQLSSHRTDFKVLHQYIDYCCEAASKVCSENSIPAIFMANKMKKLLLSMHASMSRKEKKQVHPFLLEQLHKKKLVSVKGFFEVNGELIMGILGTISTYALMLNQLDDIMQPNN